MRSIITLITFLLLSVVVFSQTDITNNYKLADTPVMSIISPYHFAEGLTVQIGKDSLINIINVDSTNHEVSNSASVTIRRNYNSGNLADWSAPQTIFSRAGHGEVEIGGGFANGVISLFFGYFIYDTATLKYTEDATYEMYSKDLGVTWDTIGPMPHIFLDTNMGYVYGNVVKADSGKYLQPFYNFHFGQVLQSTDNIHWDNPITIYDSTPTKKIITEPYIIYCGKDSLVALVRTNYRTSYQQFTSIDNGNHWINNGFTNMGFGTGGSDSFTLVSPVMLFDSLRNCIVTFATKRYGGPSNKANDHIEVYINKPQDVFSNSNGWKYKFTIKRPTPSSSLNIYGYPTANMINDTTIFCTMTDKVPQGYCGTYCGEHASIYQFTIKYHDPSLTVYKTAVAHTVNLYPNPCHDILNIDLNDGNSPDMKVKIYDALGRIIIEEKCSAFNGHGPIPVSTLSAGNYYIKIMQGNEVIIKPFTVVRK